MTTIRDKDRLRWLIQSEAKLTAEYRHRKKPEKAGWRYESHPTAHGKQSKLSGECEVSHNERRKEDTNDWALRMPNSSGDVLEHVTAPHYIKNEEEEIAILKER